jgi:ribosomal protein L37E
MPTKEFYEASEKLKRILGNTRCPMCGNNQFAIAEGYTTIPIQRSLNEFQIGGPSIPSVSVICTRCGHVSQHAIGVFEATSEVPSTVLKPES